MTPDAAAAAIAAARAELGEMELCDTLRRLILSVGAVARYLDADQDKAEPHLVKLAAVGLKLAGERLDDVLPAPATWCRLVHRSRLHGLMYLAALLGGPATAVRLPGSFCGSREQMQTAGFELAGMSLAMLVDWECADERGSLRSALPADGGGDRCPVPGALAEPGMGLDGGLAPLQAQPAGGLHGAGLAPAGAVAPALVQADLAGGVALAAD